MAKFLNMNVDDGAFKLICVHLPRADEWNDDDLVQRAFKAAKEWRYDMNQIKRSYKDAKTTEFTTESIGRMQERQIKTPMPLEMDEDVDTKTPIKVEHPIYEQYKNVVNVLKCGKGDISTHHVCVLVCFKQ